MSILVNKETRVLVQGITGKEGSFHALQCKAYGTLVVAGVTPGKGGQTLDGIPIFNSVAEAKEQTGANCSLIFVPAPFASDAILEALDAGIKLVVCITEGIPVRDMLLVKRKLLSDYQDAILIGPNCPGLITPGEAKVGIMPGHVFKPGNVGIVSRSGTLTYEAAHQLSLLNIGQSTAVGIGGDPIHGLSHEDVVRMFNEDNQTEAILLIGEIGGAEEERAAAYIKNHVKKPVFAYIAGISAPPNRRMGHAGAIISGNLGTAEAKINALESAGAIVIRDPSKIGLTIKERLK
ncbi:MAG: succinate--CoA ligase subunit alpha [Aquificaceae bacterium]|nr:succinate--CoA ligase subunit alpha [Aquificaceae bacterium]MDW8237541.1 succinate--CoA ligase subunit alpha [Aquificaceae bacterium]